MDFCQRSERIFQPVTRFSKFIHTADSDILPYGRQHIFVNVLDKIFLQLFIVGSFFQQQIGMEIMARELSPLITCVFHGEHEIEVEMGVLRNVFDHGSDLI